jgi:hypothetical protein
MKVYILMDCSATNGTETGIPVGVHQTVGDAINHADDLSITYDYDVSDDHYIVEMEMDKLYAVDEAQWYSLEDAYNLETKQLAQ